MTRSNSILIVIDPASGSHAALDRGVYLARHLRMRLELFVCDYNAHLAGLRFFDSADLKRAREEVIDDQLAFLAELADGYAEDDIDFSFSASWDTPLYEGIIRQALRSNSQYVLKETHYHSALSRALFTNTDWQLIRNCPVPLWLTSSEQEFDQPTILAAVDPLHENDKPASLDALILSAALELADQLDGATHMFHVAQVLDVHEVAESAELEHSRALGELAEKFQVPGARVHMYAGSADQLLPRVADELKTDLVIMGAVSRSRLEHAIIGSTAERVLDHLNCDVMVIKPKGYISPVTFKPQPAGSFHRQH